MSSTNVVAGISKFSVEIFQAIFTFAAASDPPHAIESSSKTLPLEEQHGYYLGWIKLSHVCHHWRIILFTMCELWAKDIGVITPAWDAFLQRSRDCHLSFNMLPLEMPDEHWIERTSPLLRNALELMDRAESLRCEILYRREDDRSTWFDWLRALESTVHPFLRSLTILFSSAFQDSGSHMRLIAPSLTFLQIRGVSVSFFTPSLRVLRLNLLPNPPHTILDSLPQVPLLEELSLDLDNGVHQEIAWDSPGSSQTGVDLRCLKHIILKADYFNSNVPDFLRVVRIPHGAKINIHINIHPDDGFNAPVPLIDALSSHFGYDSHNAMVIKVVRVEQLFPSYMFYYSVSSLTRRNGHFPVDEDALSSSYCAVTFEYDCEDLFLGQMQMELGLSTIVRHVNHSRIHDLYLQISNKPGELSEIGSHLRDGLRLLSSITHAVLDTILEKPGHVETLLATYPANSIPYVYELLFPSLTSLSLVESPAYLKSDSGGKVRKAWWAQLSDLLQTRAILCRGLPHLQTLLVRGLWEDGQEEDAISDIVLAGMEQARHFVDEIEYTCHLILDSGERKLSGRRLNGLER